MDKNIPEHACQTMADNPPSTINKAAKLISVRTLGILDGVENISSLPDICALLVDSTGWREESDTTRIYGQLTTVKISPAEDGWEEGEITEVMIDGRRVQFFTYERMERELMHADMRLATPAEYQSYIDAHVSLPYEGMCIQQISSEGKLQWFFYNQGHSGYYRALSPDGITNVTAQFSRSDKNPYTPYHPHGYNSIVTYFNRVKRFPVWGMRIK